MASFDANDVEPVVRDWIDTTGVRHDVDADPSQWPSDWDLGAADMVRVTITYPNGATDTRWFAGPFDDWNDLWDDIIEWVENGTP